MRTDMATVYDGMIEIWLEEPQDIFLKESEKRARTLWQLRRQFPTTWNGDGVRKVTQESSVLDLLWKRACVLSEHSGANGYVGAYQNCAFSLLYGIFGADVVGFLFDRKWVDGVRIDPFQPEPFLERLSILERAMQSLKEDSKIPIVLAETAQFRRPGVGTKLNRYNKALHHLLVESSLRELHDFGECGVSHLSNTGKLVAKIHIYDEH